MRSWSCRVQSPCCSFWHHPLGFLMGAADRHMEPQHLPLIRVQGKSWEMFSWAQRSSHVWCPLWC